MARPCPCCTTDILEAMTLGIHVADGAPMGAGHVGVELVNLKPETIVRCQESVQVLIQ